MRTQSHYSAHHHQHHHRPQQQAWSRQLRRVGKGMGLLPFCLLVAATTSGTQAVPTRMFSSPDSNLAGSPAVAAALPRNLLNHVLLSDIIPEEELELESLKGSGAAGKSQGYSGAEAATKSSAIDSSSTSSSSATTAPSVSSQTTSKPGLAYVKKPENEETPALSDNANSLKYGGAHAELEEALANMAHIPPSKSPSLSVSSSSIKSSPMGDAILQQRKRARSSAQTSMGLLSRAGAAAAGINLEVDYTPQDIAEYIFWMGDEHSVELAINDFIQEGLITPQEAVKFLEEVRVELTLLRDRYASAGNGRPSGLDDNSIRGYWGEGPARGLSKKQFPSLSNNVVDGPYPSYDAAKPYYYSPKMKGDGYGKELGLSSLEDLLDYEETVEKLKQRQFEVDGDSPKQREYALHGIIYKLARELFSMGFQQEPGTSVPTFTTFIESLAVNGEISKDLERSVLETLVQALVDAANEHGLLNAKSSASSSSSFSSLEGQLSRKLTAGLAAAQQGKPIIIKKKSV